MYIYIHEQEQEQGFNIKADSNKKSMQNDVQQIRLW